MKRIVSAIGNFLFIIVILYLCYFVIASAYHKTPDFFGYRMLRVMSDSMQPVFGEGDCIIIKNPGDREPAVGDIVTFVSPDPILKGAYNTHRIYDIAEDYITGKRIYYTKGDNNLWEDEYEVTADEIVGFYTGRLPFGQSVSALLDRLSERNFYFLVVIVPIVLCLTSCIVRLIRELVS